MRSNELDISINSISSKSESNESEQLAPRDASFSGATAFNYEKHVDVAASNTDTFEHDIHFRENPKRPSIMVIAIAAVFILSTAIFAIRWLSKDPLQLGNVPSLVGQSLSLGVSGSTTSFPNYQVKQQLAFVTPLEVLCKHYLFQKQKDAYQAIACFENGKWKNVMVEPLQNGNITKLDKSEVANSNIYHYLSSNMTDRPISEKKEREYLRSIRTNY